MEIVPQLIINSLISGSLYTLLALGFTLTFAAVRFFNFSHGSFAVIGAYIAFALIKRADVNPFIASIIAVIATGFIGVLLERLIFSRLRNKKSKTLVMMVASIGVLTCIQAILSLIFTNQFQTLANVHYPAKLFHIGSGVVTEYQITALIVACTATIGLLLVLRYTLIGKAIRALSDDEEVAQIVGINTNLVIMLIFFISASIAGLAGIIGGFDTGFDPAQGLHLFLKGVIAAIIGGLGSVSGALAGSFLLGFAENFGIWKIAAEWKDAIAFVLLIIFLLFRPQGLFKK